MTWKAGIPTCSLLVRPKQFSLCRVRVCVLKIQSASPRVEGWDWGSPSNARTWLGEDFHLAGWWPNPAFRSPSKWCTGSVSELGKTGRLSWGVIPESRFLTTSLGSLVLTHQVFSHQRSAWSLETPRPWASGVGEGHQEGPPVRLAWAQHFPHPPTS